MEEEREIIDQIYNNLPKQVTTQEGNQSLETMRTLTTVGRSVGKYGGIGGGIVSTTYTGSIIYYISPLIKAALMGFEITFPTFV